MPSSPLSGLNILHDSTIDTHDIPQADLLLTSPDLAAQLELWSSLAFSSDEPFPLQHHDSLKHMSTPTTLDDLVRLSEMGDMADLDDSDEPETASPTSLDLRTLLPFSLDPFLVPPTAGDAGPSLSGADGAPPAKRARPRRGSTAAGTALPAADKDTDPLTTPLTPAEDKRRRNTAASARFRAKKKEREVALEKRSKELESRVGELERECEALRRENGWLKGLVVGVTQGEAGAKRKREEHADL